MIIKSKILSVSKKPEYVSEKWSMCTYIPIFRRIGSKMWELFKIL